MEGAASFRAPARAAGLGAQGVPPASIMMLSLQPGAPNVLEQGPERRNCHTTRVQLVSAGVQAPLGLPAGTGHTQFLCRGLGLPLWVPIHLTPGCAHILGCGVSPALLTSVCPPR